MDKPENLPVNLAHQHLSASEDKNRGLIARGLIAVMSTQQQVQTKSNDALYRQARDVYNKLTDFGFESWFGYEERKQPLTEAFNIFKQLAEKGYGKAYFPLSTLYDGEQSVDGDAIQAEHYHELADDWLYNQPKSPTDLEFYADRANFCLRAIELIECGSLIYANLTNPSKDVETFRVGMHIALEDGAELGCATCMWQLSGIYEDAEDWELSLYWQIRAAIAGHGKAQSGLVVQHEHGDLADKIDEEQIFDWYVWSAESGYLCAQLFLAEAYAHDGFGLNIDFQQAAYWFTKAAEQDDEQAQFNLGRLYLNGCGVDEDYELAKYWLGKASEQNHAEACYELGMLLSQEGLDQLDKCIDLIKTSAELGYGKAQLEITADFELFGITEDERYDYFRQAFSWYENQAETGDAEMQYELAWIHLTKTESPLANRNEGLRWLKASADQNHRQACERLGNEYLKSRVNAYSTEQGIYWLSKAADLGSFHACRTLGDLYLLGHSGKFYELKQSKTFIQRINPDKELAVNWYEREIDLFKRRAYHLGKLYLSGEYLDQNLQLAEKYLLISAENGDSSAQMSLGSEYASGTKFKQNAEVAIYWLRLASEDSFQAKLLLAEIYLDGNIITKNVQEAFNLLPVEDSFRDRAMKMVSRKISSGQLNEFEERTAQAWLLQMGVETYKSVTDVNHDRFASNAYKLANLYELGLGIEMDKDKAIYWYKQSAEQGNHLAKTHLNEIGIKWEIM